MIDLRVGDTVHATLHGLADPWAIHGAATIWSVTVYDARASVILQITDHPDPLSRTHSAYANGLVTTDDEGVHHLFNPVVADPGPTAITLGRTVIERQDPALEEHHTTQSYHQLAGWYPPFGNTGPLGESALNLLDRAVQRRAAGRDQAVEAERDRDSLIRRFLAGKVDPGVLAERTGLHRSRISQIKRKPDTEQEDLPAVPAEDAAVVA
ncbi:hypothetical protein [Kitasatospora sp. MBT66]|uniref:hypothetical protein n=1 Tax=Kitasatospora sp. MBT66 TaxID=1444769 RepID=UPI0005BA224A|nr:hypothetical protein [Kitasatospora sp. MBT66]